MDMGKERIPIGYRLRIPFYGEYLYVSKNPKYVTSYCKRDARLYSTRCEALLDLARSKSAAWLEEGRIVAVYRKVAR